MNAQEPPARHHDLRVLVVWPYAHRQAIAGEVGDGREPVGAQVLEAVGADANLLPRRRARRAAVRTVRRLVRNAHARAEQRFAAVAGRRRRILLQLVRIVPGDDLGHAVQVDVGEGAQRSDAVSGDLVDPFRCERLWAQRLSCRRVIDAVADHHLRALRVRQQARDGGTAPPYGWCRFTGLRVAAVQPEKVAVLVERDEAAMLVRKLRAGRVHVARIPALARPPVAQPREPLRTAGLPPNPGEAPLVREPVVHAAARVAGQGEVLDLVVQARVR